MKKALIIFGVFALLALGLTACNRSGNGNGSDTTTEQGTTENGGGTQGSENFGFYGLLAQLYSNADAHCTP